MKRIVGTVVTGVMVGRKEGNVVDIKEGSAVIEEGPLEGTLEGSAVD